MSARYRPAKLSAKDFSLWRERHGWTQTEAGEALGLTMRTVQNYESGERHVPLVVALLCDAYDRGYHEAHRLYRFSRFAPRRSCGDGSATILRRR
jgi:transcriptional regulator with XRE-family HTH domain